MNERFRKSDSFVLRSVILSLAGLMLSVLALRAAITGPNDVSSGGATTRVLTIPITNSASTNAILIVGFGQHDTTDGDRAISSVQYQGTGFTNNLTAVTAQVDNVSDNKSGSLYYLVAPATGSNNVVISFAGVNSGVAAAVTTWQGVDQTTPVNAFTAKTNATATVVSCTATSTVDGCLFIDQYTKYLTTGTVTPAGDQTVIGNAAVGAAYWQANTYNNAGLAAGAKTFTYTNSLTSGSITILGVFQPAATTTTTGSVIRVPGLLLRGVGQ